MKDDPSRTLTEQVRLESDVLFPEVKELEEALARRATRTSVPDPTTLDAARWSTRRNRRNVSF